MLRYFFLLLDTLPFDQRMLFFLEYFNGISLALYFLRHAIQFMLNGPNSETHIVDTCCILKQHAIATSLIICQTRLIYAIICVIFADIIFLYLYYCTYHMKYKMSIISLKFLNKTVHNGGTQPIYEILHIEKRIYNLFY